MLLLVLLLPIACLAQTTQALVSGRVVNAVTAGAIAGASIEYEDASGRASGGAHAGDHGDYVLPPLSPGIYAIRIRAERFQPKEFHNMELPVAGRLQLDVHLRPLNDVWEAGQWRSAFFPQSDYVTTFSGPDITMMAASTPAIPGVYGVLEAAVSEVVARDQIRGLPLAGRDVYTLLAIQPGVTSDATTARGLGLSTAGQRPSSASFLLDGLDANQHLLSGPILAASTEAIEEYRISASNYSAEYGGTAGFLANAVTTGGGNAWHGSVFANWKNSLLNANGYQENRQGVAKAGLHEIQPGAQIGGPIRRNRLFVSAAFEFLHSRSHAPAVQLTLPGPGLRGITDPDSIARSLLDRYPAPVSSAGQDLTVSERLQPPVSVDRSFVLGRADFIARHSRIMVRVVDGRESRPDFIWSPYRDFVSGLHQPATSLAMRVSTQARPRFFHELRIGANSDDLRWDRAHPEMPTLIESGTNAILPGSLAFYGFRNRGRTYQLESQALWSRGRHVVKFGGGLLQRRLDGSLTAGEAGRYVFSDIVNFTIGWPDTFSMAADRASLPALRLPDSYRAYRYFQGSAYGQDDLRVNGRLTLNLGLRYEYSGAPSGVGAVRDLTIQPGPGDNLASQLAGARLLLQDGGERRLFRSSGNLAPRAGFALLLRQDGRTVLRGAWGAYFDRPFDNLWQGLRNNRVALATFAPPRGALYLQPATQSLLSYPLVDISGDFPNLTFIDPDWRNARVHLHFVALQHQVASGWVMQAQISGAQGGRLASTDVINRPFSLAADQGGPANPQGRINPALPLVAYRGNQGVSTYHALTGSIEHRGRLGRVQLGYTWAHAIDNQSDPLAGDFFDLNFARIGPAPDYRATAAFTRQFDRRSDRGNSDFDQRHNFVTQSIWPIPTPRRWRKVLGGWSAAQVAAFRTGFPMTVYAASGVPQSGGTILNQRADFAGNVPAADRQAVPGGYQLLNAAAFDNPIAGSIGNLGRNALRGPGMFNIDASLSRTFHIPRLGETARTVFRVDAFNILNHANLNPPNTVLTSATFGQAMYGRQGKDTGFPALIPFHETSRQLQVIIRLEF